MGEWRPGMALGRDGASQEGARSDGRTLVLWRDPIGERTLFYGRRSDGTVVFGERLGEIIAAMGRPPLDPVGLATYLSTAYVPAPDTLVQGIRAVPPGATVELDATSERLDAPLSLPAPEEAPDEALRLRLRAVLEAAVARALPEGPGGSRPVAASLSGGIDSSLVVALAARQREVHAFSVTFGPPHRDELAWSSLVARHCGAHHHAVEVGPAEIARCFDGTVAALGVPNGDPLTVPNDCLFSAASGRGLQVMLNGEGGDPCFGGPKNAPMLLAELYGGGDRADAYLRAHQKLWDELDEVLCPQWRPPGLRQAVAARAAPWLEGEDRLLDRLMAVNVVWKGAGHILPKVQHLANRHGIAARSPLFDPEVVALSAVLPGHTKRRGPVEKWLLKEAVRDLLPDSVVDRPKSGMMVPVEAWFAGELSRWATERLLEGLAPHRIVDRGWLERLCARKIGGLRPRHGVKVWLMLTLEAWLRVVYGADPTPGATLFAGSSA